MSRALIRLTCGCCAGSGEGSCDGSRCSACRGRGVVIDDGRVCDRCGEPALHDLGTDVYEDICRDCDDEMNAADAAEEAA